MKNLKPRTVSLFASLTLAIVLGVLIFLVDKKIELALIITVAVFLSSYFIYLYLIEQFIYRRIKLIYKSIHSLKLGKDLKDALGERISDDPLGDVEREVDSWGNEKKDEIEDLKKLEKFRREFLANLSHEFKTPLFSIQGYLHTLIDGAIDDPNVNRKFLEKSANSVERLVSLVSDLEEISKLEKGELKIIYETFDVNKLAEEVMDELEGKANKIGIKFNFKKGTDKKWMVNADKEKIRQVITNLIDNSLKYGKANGETVVSFYDMDEYTLIEITDNGIGINEEHLHRLFERFYRVDKSRSRDAGGTGLGLAIVKHIIEAHHQVINVRSTLHVGSTFGFTLQKAEV
jgi:two-component system phosphate regulon sensor histidine kinase PhoR